MEKKISSKERQFILEKFYNGWKVNVCVWNPKDEKEIQFERESLAKNNAGKSGEERSEVDFLKVLRQKCEKEQRPMIVAEQEAIYFFSFCDEEGFLYLFGPATAESISFSQLVSYRKRHGIHDQTFQIPVVPIGKMLNGLSMVYYMVTGRVITEKEIMKDHGELSEKSLQIEKDEFMIYEIQESTEEKRRLAYRDELKWTAEIENGVRQNTEQKLNSKEMEKLEMIGTLANKNAYKQYEYMVVTSIVLACRAAIRGGLDVYDSYMLADVYFQKVSVCTNIMELLKIYVRVVDEFSSRVREAKEHRSEDLIEECKAYIARHRIEKFSLQEIAREIGKNPSYLSRVFSEQTGKTLQAYALEKRLEAGANLLKYSEHSVGEITEYLHFSSQSYFGSYFKKQYGETPAAYRKHHKIRDFKENENEM